MRPSIAAIALLALAACRGDPEDRFFYLGTVTDGARAPLAGVEVTLSRSTSTHCAAIVGEAAYIDFESGWAPLFATQTDEQGAFLFEPMRFQVQGATGGPRCLKLNVAHGGADAEVQFYAIERDLSIPPVILMTEVSASVDATENDWVLGRPEVLPVPEVNPPGTEYDPREGSLPQAYYDWTITAGDDLLHLARVKADPVSVPRAIVEDFASPQARLELLRADFSSGDAINGGVGNPFYSLSRSAPVALEGGAPVALSRGATCGVNGEPLSAECVSTDGSLEPIHYPAPSPPGGGPIPPIEGSLYVVDLGESKVPDAFVVRNLHVGGVGALELEGSVDGEVWTKLGEISKPYAEYEYGKAYHYELRQQGLFGVYPLEPSEGIRYFRIRGEEGDRIYGIGELSLVAGSAG
jgi:hypothetical protein